MSQGGNSPVFSAMRPDFKSGELLNNSVSTSTPAATPAAAPTATTATPAATAAPATTAAPETTAAPAAPAAPIGAVGDQSLPPWARPYADQQAMLQQAQPALQSYANQSGVSDSWNRQQGLNSLNNQFSQSGAMGAQGGKGGMPGAQGTMPQGQMQQQGSSVNSTTGNDILSSRQTPVNFSELLSQFSQQHAMGQGLGSTPQATQAASSLNSLQ